MATGTPAAGGADQPPAGRRELIVHLLRDAAGPRSIAGLAEDLDVHPNTVRFHLEALVEAGRVERVLPPTHGPGRPPVGYQLRPGMNRQGPTNYRLLATMLTSHLATTAKDPARVATELGRRWGRTLVDRPSRSASRATAMAGLVGVLTELGFEPEPTGPRTSEIRLRHCPFLDLVDDQAEVICPLHLGLMQGALAAVNGPVTVDRLDPFVQPDLCVAHVAAARRTA